MAMTKEPIHYQVGENYPFTVTRIYDNFCELTDETGFKVYLQGTNGMMLVRGQRIRCRVLKNFKKRPKIEIVDYDFVEGTRTKVSEALVVNMMRELHATWAVDEMATLLMAPERGGSFDDDCQRWIAQLRHAGADLKAIQQDCCRFMEQSRFLSLCNPVERQLYQQRLTTLVEWLDCNVRAAWLVSEGRAANFVDDLLAKLKLSGYVYRPTWNFNILTCLFLIDQPLMEAKVCELFEVLRQWNPDMWLEEPLNSVLTNLVQLYIDRDIWSVDHVRNNTELTETLLQALTIQLKLMDDHAHDDLYRLNLSRLSTLSTYTVKSNGKQTLALSLSNLLSTQLQQSPYSWADTANQRVPILFSQIVPHAIDTESCYIFDRGKLSIMHGRMAIEIGRPEKPREVLPTSLGLWGGLQVVAERGELHALSANPTIADCKRFWENVETDIFRPAKSHATTKGKKAHRVGETVVITITRQDDTDPDLFLAEIDDETGGNGYIHVNDIVPYTIKANITHFRWRNGHRMRLEAEIIDRDVNDLFHFSLRENIKRYITSDFMDDGQEILVSLGAEPPRSAYQPIPAVSTDGISVSLMGFDEVNCSGVRRGQIVRTRYIGDASGDFIIKCKVTGRLSIPEYNDMQHAFLRLMEAFAFADEEDEDNEEFEKSDRILDPTYVREIIRIIDRMSVLDNEYVKSYNYLGFARILCLLIDWQSQAAYYRGRMELIVMLHDFAINDMVDENRLKDLADTNAELFHGNSLLHNRFLQLQMVSFMGREDCDAELWKAYQQNEGVVKDVASLVIAYNMVWRNNMRTQAVDIQNRIKKTLRLEGYESGLKIYGSGIEDLVTEYKTSIVFPPNNDMQPDMDRQMHNILLVIASFLNTEGGTLYIGVNDSGAGLGIDADLRHPYFFGDKDKYQRTIIDAVSTTWGNNAATYLQTQFDTANKDKDVLIVTVKPYKNGVELDGTCPVRVGSTKRRLTIEEFNEFKLDRVRHAQTADSGEASSFVQDITDDSAEVTHAAVSANEPKSITHTAVPDEKIATSQNRNNQVNNWEDDYQEDHIAYIKFTDGKFSKITNYDYDDTTMLTLAIHDNEQGAYLVLGYDDGTVTKVPMRELLKMDDNREYTRNTESPLVFASVASDKDLIVSVTQEDKTRSRRMVRADRIGIIEEGKMSARGSRLYNEGMARAGVNFEIVPGGTYDDVLKNLLDRDVRSLGFPIKTVAPEIANTLAKLGVK